MADKAFTERTTERLRLTRMKPQHAVPFAAYRAAPDVARYQSWSDYTAAQGVAFVADMQASHPDVAGKWFQFAIEERASGELVGDCALGVDEDDPRLAEIGFTIAPAFWRKGYGAEAVQGLVTYVFTELGKHRISATTDVLNAGSVALLEKLGFRREAHFRQHIWFKGRWGDEYVYAALASEWLART